MVSVALAVSAAVACCEGLCKLLMLRLLQHVFKQKLCFYSLKVLGGCAAFIQGSDYICRSNAFIKIRYSM